MTFFKGYHRPGGLLLSESSIQYTTFLAKQCKAHVAGIFFNDAVHHSYRYLELVAEDGSLSEKRMEVLNEKRVILYDGGRLPFMQPNFSYVLEGPKYLDTAVLPIKDEGYPRHLPANTLIKESMKRHFRMLNTKYFRMTRKSFTNSPVWMKMFWLF